MAAYAAMASLKQTIERILECSRISLVPPSPEIIQFAYRELEPLQKILERLDSSSPSKSRKKVNGVDGRMKEAVWRFEDLLESHLSHQILSQHERDVLLFSVDVEGLRDDVDSFVETLKGLQEEYIYELSNMPEVEEGELGCSGIDYGGMKTEMVGSSNDFENLRNRLAAGNIWSSGYSLVGVGGIGKTTLAKKVFEDPVVLRCFDHRAWVTVGRKPQVKEIARRILVQVDPKMNKITQGDEKIGEFLKERLEGKRSLIVLDDVWDAKVLDCFKTCLPEQDHGTIRMLLTTRLQSVAEDTRKSMDMVLPDHMVTLNEEESKDLLRRKVFGDEDFPRQLKKAAEKIAKNCEGLPLMIIMVADHLKAANSNDLKYWNEVAEKRSSVFMDAYNEISKVLFPSYDCLPQHVKMFFLYVGAFPQDYEISVPKLINLLTSERFIEVQSLERVVDGSLNEFGWSNNIIIGLKRTTSLPRDMKTCHVYSWWRFLLNREASKDKFLHVLNSGVDGLEESLKDQRRLCLHSNFLFSFENVYNSVKCDCASTARSLLCFGPYHQYSIPLDASFKLLRVLDALKVRFYDFPIEILKLVLLQYLALTFNQELPTSISKLVNLQFLIIHPHVSIKSSGAPSHALPLQIWDMQELKHVEILGRNLPSPTCATSLEKLSTLVGVGADSCTREVLKKLPNVRKLEIQIELSPHDDDNNTLSCLDCISELENLEKLKCSIVNPEVEYEFVAPPTSLSMLPSRLRRLHLSGLGYLWEYMEVIGSLPDLEVLKLRCCAFQGSKWGIKGKAFMRLKFLLIEDADLVQWQPRGESFPELRTLRMKHCYNLEVLHWPYAAPRGRIELVDCNPLAVACAERLKSRNAISRLEVTSTWLTNSSLST